MATRQYVGARYVPKFFDNPDGSNEWLTGIPYEALTIVTYSDIQFISKKPVPANIGAPNENTEYWIVSNSGGGGDLTPILNDIETLKTDVANIQKEINLEKRYIFIMDSYGRYTNEDGRNAPQQAYYDLGITNSYVFWKGSYSFYNDTLNFTNLLKENDSNIDKDAITDIFVIGGANDMQGNINPRIEKGIENFCSYVKSNYPNATINIGFVSQSFSNLNIPYFNQVRQAYQSCSKYGAKYMENSEYIMRGYSYYISDLVHPTAESVNRIAKQCEKMILQYSCDVHETMNIDVIINPNGIFKTGTLESTSNKAFINNGTINFEGNNGYLFQISFSAPINISKQNYLASDILISDSPWLSTNRLNGIITNFIVETNNNFVQFPCVIIPIVNNNVLSLGITYYYGQTLENVTNIYISNCFNYVN